MISDELLNMLMRRTLSNGGDYADIFIEQRRVSEIQLEDNKIEKVISGSISGIGIRLIYNGKTAYAFSNDFSEEVLFELANTVSKAASGESSKDIYIDMKKRRPDVVFPIKKIPDTVPMSAKVDIVMRGNDVARKFNDNIKQVYVACRDSLQSVKIFNSNGFISEEDRIYTTCLIRVVAIDGDVIQTGYEAIGGYIGYEIFDDVGIDTLAIKSAQRAVMMLKARRAPAGRMPVVISSDAGGTMIHEAIGHGLEADLVQQGISVYSNKKGQQIASPVVTVIDDATIPYKRGSFVFDDEGTPSKRNVLVKDGILIGYMYDNFTAMNEGVSSTGNGRRESFEHKPIPRMSNTFIAPGKLSPDEVIKSVPKGLFVKKMGGGQVNTVTGDFVFEVQEGYTIDNGEVLEPVRGANLIGNGPEILKSIDMVANDLGFSIGTCGKDSQGVPVSDAMPTLRITEMVVGGEIR